MSVHTSADYAKTISTGAIHAIYVVHTLVWEQKHLQRFISI
uniref:Uncharacterized protein n=1 Tax=Wuchereria bancrofti TaxID=6293 RepID=A0AAF5RXH8_WUCBA